MEDREYMDDLEHLLSDAAEKHQMFPSDHIWSNIRKEVQSEKSWPALSIIAFLIIVALTVATFLNYPPDNIIAKIKYQDSLQKEQVQELLAAQKKNRENPDPIISPTRITDKTLATFKNQEADLNYSYNLYQASTVSVKEEIKNVEPIEKTLDKKPIAGNNNAPAKGYDYTAENKQLADIVVEQLVSNAQVVATDNEDKKEPAEQGSDKALSRKLIAVNLNDEEEDPAIRRSRLKWERQNAPSRWSYEFYTTPSISYRSLEDDRTRDKYNNTTPTAPGTTQGALDSSKIRHKPALGTEVGVGLLYGLSSRLRLKMGLQFNIRQYYIDAYQSYGVATIAIVQNNRVDSINVASRYSNIASYSAAKLDNRMYQISIPIGLQYDAIQSAKWGVSIGASIQPTFTLNKNVYMISTDYKYYANGESFFRKFNINTAVDLNVNYKIGDNTKLYLGPQIRYQHLPTYNDAYPIKEYRWDYGVKIGIMKSF